MDLNSKHMQSTKKTLATAASLAASAMLARTVVNDVLPCEVRNYLSSAADSVRTWLHNQHTILIKEKEGYSTNQIYEAAEIYLATKVSTSTRRVRVSKLHNEQKAITVSLEEGEEMVDVFDDLPFKWQFFCKDSGNSSNEDLPAEMRSFQLTFHGKYKDLVLASYLPHILDRAQAIKAQDRALNLYMNNGQYWQPIKLRHPATFDTIAMDPELKRAVMDDLDRFRKRKEYYRRIGKAWKRGYLLYGPPGTGKSSLVAAMANYLKFDIYDLQLSEVGWDKSLQQLLVGMGDKSILVVEDIDCSMEMMNREAENKGQGSDEKVTLSGLLNSVDGLWSTYGEERIVVFTTNYRDRLDPALLRPGRMDMHIYTGYCGVHAFRMLASNYHGIEKHSLSEKIEGLIKEVEVTPAEVAEQLMRSDDTEIALLGLTEFLQDKREKVVGSEAEGKRRKLKV